jgi:hypothetical protein
MEKDYYCLLATEEEKATILNDTAAANISYKKSVFYTKP